MKRSMSLRTQAASFSVGSGCFFGGWKDQPEEGGTPLFGYGSIGYTKLTDLAQAAASPGPSGAPADAAGASGGTAPTPAPSGGSTSSSSSNMLPVILGIGALVVIIAVGLIVMRGRRGSAEEE